MNQFIILQNNDINTDIIYNFIAVFVQRNYILNSKNDIKNIYINIIVD